MLEVANHQHVEAPPLAEPPAAVEAELPEAPAAPRQCGHLVHLTEPHDLHEEGGRLKCKRCPGSSSLGSASASVKAFARARCRGDPLGCPGKNHDLWLTGPFLWCTRCGSFSSGQRVARGIKEDCVGAKGLSAKGQTVVKRLARGCHPNTGKRAGVAARNLRNW